MSGSNRPDSVVMAAVDIGTNTLKFTVAACDSDGRVNPIEERAETVRIGAGIDSTGRIDDLRAKRAIAALKSFEETAKRAGAISLTGVATETLRLATNGAEFLARIHSDTGWRIKVISGDEEARLTFVGLLPMIPAEGRTCIVDIGGGSSEWVETEHHEMLSAQSLPVGSGRLADRLFSVDPPGPAALEAAKRSAEQVLSSRIALPQREAAHLLLSGGNGQFLDQLRAALVYGPRLDRTTIDRVLTYLATAEAATVGEMIGIPMERARVLPAGIAIAAAAVELIQPATIDAVPSGIRNGLLLEQARMHFGARS